MNMLQVDQNSYLLSNPHGKIETIIDKIEENYVFAKCYLYANKEDTAYMICESGVAEKENGQSNGQICSSVTNIAYENALSRLSSTPYSTFPIAEKIEESTAEEINNLNKESHSAFGGASDNTDTMVLTSENIRAVIETPELATLPETGIINSDGSTEKDTIVKLELNAKEPDGKESTSYLDVVLDILGRVKTFATVSDTGKITYYEQTSMEVTNDFI